MSSENDDNDNGNVNWPTAFLYAFGMLVLAFICYGDKIIDALSK